ncbi:MAG: endonuclease/exonuclease/phosphatase family protein [Chitinophagales bacterium]
MDAESISTMVKSQKGSLPLKYVCLLAVCVFSAFYCPLKAQGSSEDSLRILSYNIKMLPRFLVHLHHKPLARARLIPEVIAADSPHVIVFQEAFDRKAMKIIRKGLAQDYPYVLGPANGKRPSFKVSSGVMLFSKLPLTELGEVDFHNCEMEDCFARKGALLAQASWQGKPFQVMGTHMEAGGSPELKQSQYNEIEGLMRTHRKDSIPQFYCGDFNTRKSTANYDTMLLCFGAQDGPFCSDLQYTSDHMLSDMYPYSATHRRVVDFILCRDNKCGAVSVTREVHRYEGCWSKNHCDLSDHFAVLLKAIW